MRRTLLFSLLMLVLVPPVGCGSGGANHGVEGRSHTDGGSVSLVAYSTPKPVMEKLIAEFKRTSAGHGVSFSQSYGPSGSQARAVAAGQPADVAFLSTGLDVDTLADAGLVGRNWVSAADGGDAADSVVAFAVRPGNPKHIHSWSDLVKRGVQVVSPDPFSSGSAKWNALAAYGAMRKTGMNDKQATAFVTKLFSHVVSQDSSGSDAMSTFLAGKGDVLITYESEVYAALASGSHLGIVVPNPTMLIELPMVATNSASTAAKAFISYCHTPAAQTILAENGYRPVDDGVLKRPALAKWRQRYSAGGASPVTIDDPLFGGWRKVNADWFDPSNGRMLGIEKAVGGPTS